ncbi:MAG TPA: DASS family sodium-coupled anion symporter [Candidatus Kryptonia bacterium]|nr:DASS family sodium-coupled anion symporter [Candidatus Kryptonia bacterium]
MPSEIEVVVDTRPLWLILLSRGRHTFYLAFGMGLYWITLAAPLPHGLTREGQKALAVFALCVFYWVFSVLPLMITSLLAIILLPLSGVMRSSQAYALFGNEAVFFILGAFILAACFMKSGLSTRIALGLLHRFGSTPRRLLLTVYVLNSVMAFFMSEHAVAAMNFPIIVEMVAVLGLPRMRSNYARCLFLAMAWGSSIGGIATLLGGARAPLALGILREATGQSYSFLEWTLLALPLVLVLMVAGYWIMIWFFPIEIETVAGVEELLNERWMKLGRASFEERTIGAVMLVTLIAWIVGGEEFGLANIALAAVVVLFMLGIVTWRDIEHHVNWGVLLMYGGAIALGAAINSSGAAAWLSQVTISHWASNGFTVVLLMSLVSLLLTEAMSHSAVVALLMPVSIGVAKEFGLDPRLMAPVVALPAGLAFTLPIGTPANAIAYSSGYLRMRDMLLPGALLELLAWLAFNLSARWYWPLLGIHIQ